MPRLFVDHLTVIDCSVLHPQRGLIGASWVVDVELLGELDQQSMVFDFALVKKTLKQVIDCEVDHKLLVPLHYSECVVKHEENNDGDQVNIRFIDQRQQAIEHHSPASALCLVECEKITRNHLVKFLTGKLMEELPSNVQELRITLHKEKRKGDFYTYSHGLKKHLGNCQRIAHGHRSTIHIWKNGKRKRSLEKKLAKRWSDIYLGSREDISRYDDNSIQFKYQTQQGHFSLQLPRHRVHLMDCDTTVECIAGHIVELLQSDNPETRFRVKAFEGIKKGAIASN